MNKEQTAEKCCYCGATDRLHSYGEIDSGFSSDPFSGHRKIYACQSCDPIFTQTIYPTA